jgi:DNA (cytosine-5)-methyltransferase 1
MNEKEQPTIGSLFAGIGGFDLGFERAGFRTAWQVEINPINRAVLADRFPHAERFEDVRACGRQNLAPVDCITAGFPCQDISVAGNRKKDKTQSGLKGKRSGLFFEVMRILDEIRPVWVVLENVEALLHSNDCADFETVIAQLAGRGYVGCFRVLDAQYFGIPQRRRRVFVVGHLGSHPPIGLLSDAAPVERLLAQSISGARIPGNQSAGYTLQASDTRSRIDITTPPLVCEEAGWDQVLQRERMSEVDGVPLGMDDWNLAHRYASGNAVCPPVAQWIAEKIINEIRKS